MKIIGITAIFLLIIAPAQAAEWGSLTGRFVYDGDAPAPQKLTINKGFGNCGGEPALMDESLLVNEKNGGLANVVIWVRTKDVEVHPDYAKSSKDKVVIESTHCRFDPHIVVYRLGQPLELKNSDPVGLNFKLDMLANNAISNVLQANTSLEIKPLELPEKTPINIDSNGHPWMKGCLIVQPHPYVAVSDEDGRFAIRNLPAGKELEFQVWQEKSGYVQRANIKGKDANWQRGRFKMTLNPGSQGNYLGEIKLDPVQFNK